MNFEIRLLKESFINKTKGQDGYVALIDETRDLLLDRGDEYCLLTKYFLNFGDGVETPHPAGEDAYAASTLRGTFERLMDSDAVAIHAAVSSLMKEITMVAVLLPCQLRDGEITHPIQELKEIIKEQGGALSEGDSDETH